TTEAEGHCGEIGRDVDGRFEHFVLELRLDEEHERERARQVRCERNGMAQLRRRDLQEPAVALVDQTCDAEACRLRYATRAARTAGRLDLAVCTQRHQGGANRDVTHPGVLLHARRQTGRRGRVTVERVGEVF